MKPIKLIIIFLLILGGIVVAYCQLGGLNDSVPSDNPQAIEKLREINKKLENGALTFEEVKKFYDELQKSDDSLIMMCNRIYAYAQIVDALGSQNMEAINNKKDKFKSQINAIHLKQLDTVVINQETFNNFKNKASNITRFDQLSTCYIPTKYVCDYCGQSVPDLTKHKNNKAHWFCVTCGLRFKKEGVLDAHINNNHTTDTNNTTSVCDFCRKSFADLAKHKYEKGHWFCVTCGLCFRKERELDAHINNNHITDTNNTTSVCDFCRKSFADLAKHKYEKGHWFCVTCGLRFRKERELDAHINNNHITNTITMEE